MQGYIQGDTTMATWNDPNLAGRWSGATGVGTVHGGWGWLGRHGRRKTNRRTPFLPCSAPLRVGWAGVGGGNGGGDGCTVWLHTLGSEEPSITGGAPERAGKSLGSQRSFRWRMGGAGWDGCLLLVYSSVDCSTLKREDAGLKMPSLVDRTAATTTNAGLEEEKSNGTLIYSVTRSEEPYKFGSLFDTGPGSYLYMYPPGLHREVGQTWSQCL